MNALNINEGPTHDHHSDCLRVTSIPFKNTKYVMFTGVPLKKNSYELNSGKYFISIKSDISMLPVLPSIGQQWEVTGHRIIKDVEAGDYMMKQHVYDKPYRVVCTLPNSGETLINFIAREKDFKGIGESKARELWQTLGKDFHEILRNDSAESRHRLKGILSDDSVNSLYDGYAKYSNLKACNWMSEIRIPSQIQQRIIKHHNEKTIDALSRNPYSLLGFGMSFSDVDAIGLNLFNVTVDDSRRLSAAVEFAIKKEISKGHTYTSQADLRPTVRKLLSSNELMSLAFQKSCEKAQFLLNKKTGNYHPTAQILMESVVAKRLLKLVAQRDLQNDDSEVAYYSAIQDLPYQLTSMQTQAVLTSLNNAVSCITGGAGTGKTTVLRTALRAFFQMGYKIHAVALSGRAAMRLHESIGFNTLTIAGFLRNEAITPNDDEPFHLLVIDESSMIDLPTMYRIVTHIDPSVRIIFSGDPDQLPPIGCGKVLADIVESGIIKNTRLDIVKRQDASTGIPEYSMLINAGIVPDNLTTNAITFHEADKDKIAIKCTELYALSPKSSRIIGATKIMVAAINKLAQDVVNPDGKLLQFEMNGELFFLKFRQNDSILFTQNNYEKGIQNGSLGLLSSVEKVQQIYGSVELDTGHKIEITPTVLDCMELGYCITLHKAQGSQFPRIIIALQQGRIVDRAWLYTAITRAEAEIHIVGSSDVFRAVIRNASHSHNRNSYLSKMLEFEFDL